MQFGFLTVFASSYSEILCENLKVSVTVEATGNLHGTTQATNRGKSSPGIITDIDITCSQIQSDLRSSHLVLYCFDIITTAIKFQENRKIVTLGGSLVLRESTES